MLLWVRKTEWKECKMQIIVYNTVQYLEIDGRYLHHLVKGVMLLIGLIWLRLHRNPELILCVMWEASVSVR